MRKVARELKKMDARADNLLPVWRKMGSGIARDNRRAFATRGTSVGAKWKPLAKSTVKQKAAMGFPRASLRRSGDLYRSFTGRPMGIEIYEAHAAHYGSPLMTAVWQQRGTFRNGKRHIPPRLIQKLSDERRAEYRQLIVRYVVFGKTR
jgi:hypothetical protein